MPIRKIQLAAFAAIWLGAGLVSPAPGALAAEPPALRTWTDNSGKHTINARLLRQTEDSVVLETDAGKQVTVPLSRLSQADREFLQTGAAKPSEPAAPQASTSAATAGLRYTNSTKLKIRMGMEVTAGSGACTGLVATFPLPMDWPEQRVTIVDRDISPPMLKVTTKTLNDGVQQVEFRVPQLPAGESAHVIFTLDIERFHIEPPEHPESLVLPTRIDAKLRPYLAESPLIEIGHPKVKAAANEIRLDADQPAWRQVRTIYDWTRERVKWDGTKPLKGALQALEGGNGDCEEITSLFVAMCRLKGIPARSVWVDGHAYPEFYLEDAAGHGLWIPCESLGAERFGGMNRYQLLLQKGDNFRMAQKSGPQRYVTPTISGSVARGGTQPTLREIRENVE